MITFEQKELLISLIDMDNWQYSWHNNVYDADRKSINEKLRIIISEKLAKNFNEMNDLMKGYNLLLSLELKEDKETEINNNYDPADDLPF